MTEYEKYRKEIADLSKKIGDAEDECARKGMPFEEMCEATKDARLEVYRLDKEMRLVKDPAINFKKKWKGERMPLQEFIKDVNDGYFIDEDGYGLYATESGVSDVEIYPSDITENKYRKDFTHVLWLNR